MSTAATKLRKEFVFLKYGAEQCNDQTSFTVHQDAFWSYCGPLLVSSPSNQEPRLPSNFYDFEAETCIGTILPQFVPFLDFINAFLFASGLGHYFLTIRATTLTHEFDRPRWHTDELFFSKLPDGAIPGTRLGAKSRSKASKQSQTASGTNWKICTTLRGPPTLFIPLERQSSARTQQNLIRKAASTDHSCTSIRCVGCASAADVVREKLASQLSGFGATAAMPGECALFKVGRDSGAIHSEPCMSEESGGRIFVNVIPGTKEELEGLMEKWGMEFPRQWWLRGHAY